MRVTGRLKPEFGGIPVVGEDVMRLQVRPRTREYAGEGSVGEF